MANEGVYEREIAEQPEALSRLLTMPAIGDVSAVGAVIRARAPRFVVIAARGSSDNAARYAQYLFGIKNGVTVALATPSLFTLYGARPSMHDALVIGVSQSGRSPDVVAVLTEARAQGALTLALTNADDAPLARAAEHHVSLRAGPERAVPASKTYTNQLLALALLSAAWSDDDTFVDALMGAPDLARAALALPVDASTWRDTERVVVLARGLCFGTAHEIALKLKETARIAAEPHSIADFAHGPVAAVAAGARAIIVAPSSRADADADTAITQLADRGVQLSVISDRESLLARAALPLRVPACPEALAPIVCAIAGQRLSAALSRARGFDPDAPAGLAKVTETR